MKNLLAATLLILSFFIIQVLSQTADTSESVIFIKFYSENFSDPFSVIEIPVPKDKEGMGFGGASCGGVCKKDSVMCNLAYSGSIHRINTYEYKICESIVKS